VMRLHQVSLAYFTKVASGNMVCKSSIRCARFSTTSNSTGTSDSKQDETKNQDPILRHLKKINLDMEFVKAVVLSTQARMDELQQALLDANFLPAEVTVPKSALMMKRNIKAAAALTSYSKTKRLTNALRLLDIPPEGPPTLEEHKNKKMEDKLFKDGEFRTLKEFKHFQTSLGRDPLKFGKFSKQRSAEAKSTKLKNRVKKKYRKHIREILGEEDSDLPDLPINKTSQDSKTERKSLFIWKVLKLHPKCTELFQNWNSPFRIH